MVSLSPLRPSRPPRRPAGPRRPNPYPVGVILVPKLAPNRPRRVTTSRSPRSRQQLSTGCRVCANPNLSVCCGSGSCSTRKRWPHPGEEDEIRAQGLEGEERSEAPFQGCHAFLLPWPSESSPWITFAPASPRIAFALGKTAATPIPFPDTQLNLSGALATLQQAISHPFPTQATICSPQLQFHRAVLHLRLATPQALRAIIPIWQCRIWTMPGFNRRRRRRRRWMGWRISEPGPWQVTMNSLIFPSRSFPDGHF
ncbi:hypothetical protein B0H14DRAFT_1420254 [Mycena olivaceomarginata]|nr:hypothetical protein B0H14DRAFT_1420254 [Mycena olivaceomarginata]